MTAILALAAQGPTQRQDLPFGIAAAAFILVGSYAWKRFGPAKMIVAGLAAAAIYVYTKGQS